MKKSSVPVRESWKSRLGFIAAAAGSAVGLANIWRFPYLVGEHGGGAFVLLYLLSLALLGFPIFMLEVVLGRTTKKGPVGSLLTLSGERRWANAGKGLITIGFIVSSLYSVISGWVLGYLYEALRGRLRPLDTIDASKAAFSDWIGSPAWVLLFHFLFMGLAVFVLLAGVRKGIERGNKIMMPALLLLLLVMAVRGLLLPGSSEALSFIFRLDFSQIGGAAVLAALGQAFFTLSLGQGTMITYGSYLKGGENLLTTCLPVALFDTMISILASIAILTVVFAGGFPPSSGFGLMFETLPTVFNSIPGGGWFAIAFFILVVLAALSSQISAMEPLINYFIFGKGWRRPSAVLVCASGAFLLGVPSALSFSLMKGWTVGGWTFFQWINFITIDIAIPIGALTVLLFAGWEWGCHSVVEALRNGMSRFLDRNRWFDPFYSFLIKYLCSLLIGVILLHEIWIGLRQLF